ncbi:MAG: phosphatase PAP2 family protein [Polyangiaceae bacterium]|jgi:hypothetical protein
MSIIDADSRYAHRRQYPNEEQLPLSVPGFGAPNGLPVEPSAPAIGPFISHFASQDWLILGFFATQMVALAFGRGPGRGASLLRVAMDLALYFFVLTVIRLPILRWGSAASSLVYRSAVVLAVVGSYFQLRDILPAVSPWWDDASIYSFDLRVFRFEPAVWLDRFVSPITTEWFAFFYFLYFLILIVHVLPMVFLAHDRRVLGRFSVGLLLVFLTAHLFYMAVPGWGPYWFLKGAFEHELRGGMFWRWVREAVEAGGAQKDIFPSLHTAVPTFLAIFSFRHRKLTPFQFTWPVLAFFASQIIVATMFLRWHYLVDVVGGLTLAVGAAIVGQKIADWESAKRERGGRQSAWTPLVYPWRSSSLR